MKQFRIVLFILLLSVVKNEAVFSLSPASNKEISIAEYYSDLLINGDNKNNDYFREIDLLSREEIWEIVAFYLKEINIEIVVHEEYDEYLGETNIEFYLENFKSGKLDGNLFVSFSDFEPFKLSLDGIWLEDSPKIRGRRIMPVLYRWIATHPKFGDQFSGWQVVSETTDVSTKAWMRGSLFNPASFKEDVSLPLNNIFGHFPSWKRVFLHSDRINASISA